MIYPVDSAIQRLNNWSLLFSDYVVDSTIHLLKQYYSITYSSPDVPYTETIMYQSIPKPPMPLGKPLSIRLFWKILVKIPGMLAVKMVKCPNG